MKTFIRRLSVVLFCSAALAASAQTPAGQTPSSQTQTTAPAAVPNAGAQAQIAAAAQVAIQVDLAKPLGAYKPIGDWFGYDESNYTTMKYGRQLLRELHDLSPVPVTIRAHHLFTSGDGVARLKWSSSNVFMLDANGKPVYDFTVLDGIFDAYHAAGVRPMVELGFMPEALATGAGPYYVPYPKTLDGAVQSPPKDYAMWGDLVRRFTEHMVERYGRDEVATWTFEVWNEPDISYWKGTPADYFKLYDYSVAGVRKALPGAMVGGPAVTGPGSMRANSFLQKFFDHCANDKNAETGEAIPLDFVSFHPKGSPRWIAAGAGEAGHVRMGISNELNAAANGFRIVAASAKYHDLPIILSEADPEGCAACSAKENPANGYRNGLMYPAYTAVAMKALADLAAQSKVNLVGMVTWSFEFEDKGYFEGFRTLATNGVDKPELNIFRMAGMFSGDRVATTSSAQVPVEEIVKAGVRGKADVDAFATKSAHEAAVMIWNYHDDDLHAGDAEVTVQIAGIPAGVHRVLLEHFRIDETHSNAYTAWKAVGEPQSPTQEQYAKLKEAGQLELLGSPEWVEVSGGAVTIATQLPRQATSLLHLEW
jgi:xylan 1,4-beta-xylosidase